MFVLLFSEPSFNILPKNEKKNCLLAHLTVVLCRLGLFFPFWITAQRLAHGKQPLIRWKFWSI